MNRRVGVTVGKFNPPHLGHAHLLDVAAGQVDHLYILIGDRRDQTIPATERARWLMEIVPDNVSTIITPDDLPAENEPWARRALAELPEQPSVAFTSEPWGDGWAAAMGATHISVDLQRLAFPVSATLIRSDLRLHFDYLIPPARAALARKVVVAGAESTGKTTLARQLADHYNTVWIPEYGRTYWEGRRYVDPQWSSEEFVRIATTHHEIALDLSHRASSGLVVGDTDALVTAVWHRRYLGSISAGVDAVAKAHRPDLYLVTRPDLEWVQDGTRESNGFRREMHDWTIAAIEDAGIPYQIVSGDPEERLRQSIDVIEPFLQFQHLI